MRSAAAIALVACAASGAFGQAEQAPPDYVPPAKRGHENAGGESAGHENAGGESANAGGEGAGQKSGGPPRGQAQAEPPPRWNLAVGPRVSLLIGGSANGVPTVGYGAGVRLHVALVKLGPLRFGLAAQFAYDRFSSDGGQALSHASFGGLGVLDGLFSIVRPWIGVGAGFSVADYQSATQLGVMRPPDAVSVVPLVTLAFGLGVQVFRGFELGLRGDLDLTFSSQAGGTPPRTLFSPGLFGLTFDLGFRF